MPEAKKRRRAVHGGGTSWIWVVTLIVGAGLVIFILSDTRRPRRPQGAPTATTIYRTLEPAPAAQPQRPTRTATPTPGYPKGVPVAPPMQSHTSPPSSASSPRSAATSKASAPSRPSRPAAPPGGHGAGSAGSETQPESDSGYGVPGYGRPLPRPNEYSPPGYGAPLKEAGRPAGY